MFDLGTFTAVHTALSLVALVTGVVVVADLLNAKVRRTWTVLFLATAVATSATGFGFPFHGVLPSHVLSVISLVVLAVAIYALYVAGLSGVWRPIYAATIVVGLYFLVFVGIAQAFLKIPAVKSLAPTSTEPPFLVAQLVALVGFIALGVVAARSFRRAAPRMALI